MAKSIGYDSLDYYKILNVLPTASDDEIRQKYRELAKFWHPDHNSAPEAVDMFQKISVAYDILKEPKSRLKYDILSMIYPAASFPNMAALALIRNMHGAEDINLRAFRLMEVTGKGISHTLIDKVYYCNPAEALSVIGSITRHNWLYGFLGVSAFFVNIKAILRNLYALENRKDNLALLLHNSLVYQEEGKFNEAATLAVAAKEYASSNEQTYIDKYLTSFEYGQLIGIKKWDFSKLKRIQLFYPFLLIFAIIVIIGCFLFTPKNDTIQAQLKQFVIFNNGERVFSDVAVAKIFDVPVDVYDKQYLYHLTQTTDARHGADDEFDIYKTIEKGTTVRLTGYTADKKWIRVMFDNGEMAFVKAIYLQQGIGNDIPLWSKIYKEE